MAPAQEGGVNTSRRITLVGMEEEEDMSQQNSQGGQWDLNSITNNIIQYQTQGKDV